MTAPGSLSARPAVTGPYTGRTRRNTVRAMVSAPLRRCWPRPWTQPVSRNAGLAVVGAGGLTRVWSGSWPAAVVVVAAGAAAFGAAAAGLLVVLWCVAGTARAGRWRILEDGTGRSVTAAARLAERGDHRVLVDLVAVPAGQGAGAELVRAIQAERRPIVLTPANRRLCVFYNERLGFERVGPPRRLFRSRYRWDPPGADQT